MAIAPTLLRMVRRLRYPWMAKAADDLIEEGLPFLDKAPEAFIPEAGESTYQFLRKGERPTLSLYRRFMNQIHSPDFVMGRDASGQKMIDSATHWDLRKNVEMEPLIKEYVGVRRRWKGRDADLERLFKALEDPTAVSQLRPKDREALDFFNRMYDFTAQQRIKYLAGGDEMYDKIIRMTRREVDAGELLALSDPQREAYAFAKAKKANYAPHVFDRDALIERFARKADELGQLVKQTKSPRKIKFLEDQIREYENSMKRLAQGEPIEWEILPKEFRFKHQLKRTDVEGFVRDPFKAFESYLFNWGRAMYDDAAVKEMKAAYDELALSSPQLLPYAKHFIREFAGFNHKDAFDKVAGWIASFQYMRTMGGNLRSPIVNLTQQFNTLVDIGPKASARGYIKMFDPYIQSMWKKSGLKAEVPHAFGAEVSPLVVDRASRTIEQSKRILGFMFNKAEEFNRKHAFAAYFNRALGLGRSEVDAMQDAIRGVHKVQFQYGRVGMPMVLRTPAGRVLGQFTSFTIKQMEFLWKLAREDPKKLIGWVGGAYGMNVGVDHLVGLDISNALGFGMNLGEAVSALRDMTRGDFDEAMAHGQLALSGGTGILPTGFGGPTVGQIKDIKERIGRGEPVAKALSQSFGMVQWNRVEDLYRSLINKTAEGKYPVFRSGGTEERMYETGLRQVLLDALGPRTAERTKKTHEWYKQRTFDQLESKRKRIIAQEIAKGNGTRAEKLMKQWQVYPTLDTVVNAYAAHLLPRSMRKPWIEREMRQLLREQAGLAEEAEE